MKTKDEFADSIASEPTDSSARIKPMEAESGSAVVDDNLKNADAINWRTINKIFCAVIDEKLKYDDESEAIHAKQHHNAEELKRPEEAGSDTLETDDQSAYEDFDFPGIIFY